MDNIQIEVIERLARIEENQGFLKSRFVEDEVERKEAYHKMVERVESLETFKDAINQKIAYIGGVVVVIGMAIPTAINWITSHIKWSNL